MVALLNGRVEGAELVVVLSAFVDESGTGDEPNVILAALVGEVNGWLAFNAEWQTMLDVNEVDHAHYKDMRGSRPPFRGWTMNKKERFSRTSYAIIKERCLFAFTVSLSKALYREKYREPCLAEGISPDSAYALCAREVFGYAINMAEKHLGYTEPMNFIFEAGHVNSTNAAAVFEDLKEHSEVGQRLGFFALEDKKKLKPLQGADHLAHQGRRSEAAQLKKGFIEVDANRYSEDFSSIHADGCPVFYWAFTEEMLDYHRRQHHVLKGIRKRKRKGTENG